VTPDGTRLNRRKVTARRALMVMLVLLGIGLYMLLGDPTFLNGVIGGVVAGGVALGLAYAADRAYRNRAK
jgi:hypothetical protein